MATTADLLADALGRIGTTAHEVVEGLTPDQLAHRIEDRANSIAWLVWHQARITDDHVADAADADQVWTADDWAARFDLSLEESDTGYGHSAEQVAQVRADGEQLLGYSDAVLARARTYVTGLSDDDLDCIVDDSWEPAVTLAVRLVSVVSDDLQHLGQAALIRGLLAD